MERSVWFHDEILLKPRTETADEVALILRDTMEDLRSGKPLL
jgi:hypothetical protein